MGIRLVECRGPRKQQWCTPAEHGLVCSPASCTTKVGRPWPAAAAASCRSSCSRGLMVQGPPEYSSQLPADPPASQCAGAGPTSGRQQALQQSPTWVEEARRQTLGWPQRSQCASAAVCRSSCSRSTAPTAACAHCAPICRGESSNHSDAFTEEAELTAVGRAAAGRIWLPQPHLALAHLQLVIHHLARESEAHA